MFNPNRLTPEDRRLYDDTVHDAIINPADGSCRPTRDAGNILYESLFHLAASHGWADELLRQAASQSLGAKAKAWAKAQQFIDTPFGQRTVSKSAFFAAKRRNDDGTKIDQLELWENATTDDLRAVISRNTLMTDGLAVETSVAINLLRLCLKHRMNTVPEALAAEGATLQEFLDGEAESA